MKLWQRITIVTIGFVESLIFSGCIFGWPSLQHVLQEEGVYSHLCLKEILPFNESRNNLILNNTPDSFEGRDALNSIGEIFEKETLELIENSLIDLEKLRNEEENPTENRIRVTCEEQIVQMTLIYTVCAVAYGMASFLVGFSLDICGLWFTRILGSIMTTGGFLFLAFTSKDMPWLLWPALNLIALGSSQLRLSTFQFANLWPQKRTTILILYSSAYSVSTTMFLVIQFAYLWKLPYKAIGLAFTGVALLTIPVTFVMPRMRVDDHVYKARKSISKNEKASKAYQSTTAKALTSEELWPMKSCEDIESTEVCNPRVLDRDVPLGTSLWTLSSLLHTLWHFVNFFLVFFYSATFLPWLHKMSTDSDSIAHYNKISGLCALIAPCFIPIAGLITDWQIKKASQHENRIQRMALTMQAPASTMAVATLFILAMMICKLFFTEAAVYVSLVLVAVSRPFVVGSCASYIRIRFHPSHFNRLNGIFTTVVYICFLVQYPLILWMKRSTEDFVYAQILLIVILVATLVSPGHMMIKKLATKYAEQQLKFRSDV